MSGNLMLVSSLALPPHAYRLVAKTFLWNSQAERLTREHLSIAFLLMRHREGYSASIQAFQELNTAAVVAFIQGQIEECPLVYWTPPCSITSPDQLKDALMQLCFMEKSAVLCALAEGEDIPNLAHWRWNGIRKRQLTPLSCSILGRLPRQIHSDLVFWVSSHSGPAPIFHLPGKISEVTGLSWREFQQQARQSLGI